MLTEFYRAPLTCLRLQWAGLESWRHWQQWWGQDGQYLMLQASAANSHVGLVAGHLYRFWNSSPLPHCIEFHHQHGFFSPVLCKCTVDNICIYVRLTFLQWQCYIKSWSRTKSQAKHKLYGRYQNTCISWMFCIAIFAGVQKKKEQQMYCACKFISMHVCTNNSRNVQTNGYIFQYMHKQYSCMGTHTASSCAVLRRKLQ